MHIGHLLAAQDAFEQLDLDKLVFVPSAQSPLKGRSPSIPSDERVDLLREAIGAVAFFEISTVEIERGGTSYTVDTVALLRKQYPEDRLFWIIGEDQLQKLPQWNRIELLCESIEFGCLRRTGYEAKALPVIPLLRVHPIKSHRIEVSSTEIRDRIRSNLPIHFFTPERVVSRIHSNKLYSSRHKES